MDNNSGIYKITYREKVYIGQSKNLGKRMDDHLRELRRNKHYNIHLQNAFNKYGEDNYEIEVIEYCDESELDKKEIFWIDYYDSYKNGYNQTSGGTGIGHNSKVYRYTYVKYYGKKKMVHKIINLSTGKIYDTPYDVKEEYNLKDLGQLHKVCSGLGYTCRGCFWCYDYYGIDIKEEFRLANERYSNYIQNSKTQTINITTQEIFDSANQAAKFYNIPASSVVNCINGKQKTAYGYKFRKYNDNNIVEEEHQNNIRNKRGSPKPKKVINVDTKEIFNSICEASIATKISNSNISECCRHKRPSAGGYQWEFYIEDMDINKIPKRKKQLIVRKIINLATGTIYDNATQASKELNININSILKVCKKKQKTACGYKFEFYEE